ncbi:MAG: hypothetical protein WA714_22035, partial [Candidatus Acidiferrales bacterium]
GGEWTWGDFGYLLVSSFLPTRIVEFVMLEGSIVALLIGTVAMLICHIAFERSRWVVLPNLFSAVKLGGSTRNQGEYVRYCLIKALTFHVEFQVTGNATYRDIASHPL